MSIPVSVDSGTRNRTGIHREQSLRICFVVESGTDVRLVEGLTERFAVTFLTREVPGGASISQSPSQPINVLSGPPSRAAFAKLVFRHVRNSAKNYDFVLTQGYGLASLAASLACRMSGLAWARLVCSPVELYYAQRKKYPADGKQFRLGELVALQVVARLNAISGGPYIVLSDHLRQVVRNHGASNISQIPLYGVDTEIFAPPKRTKAALRASLGLPESGALIFFSSRVAPEKDSETLLGAFQDLLHAGADIWLLHRSGGYRSFLGDAARFGVSERVIATDAVHPHQELPLDYQAVDLCVQASRAEGLGFSALEALACGAPVVATAVGGLRETIVDGETGWTYPAGDRKALAAVITEALQSPVEAQRRSIIGRKLVEKRYSRSVVFDQFEQFVRAATRARCQ